MVLHLLSSVYGRAIASRRSWYARHSESRRRLERPVISVGSLRVGGSGKTPIVEHLARILLEHGYRPAVLTRGYARRELSDGVTVVSDGERIIAGPSASGDEPLMLARALPGAMVLVGADRHVSGTFAEQTLGATIHILDDGFQHLRLERDVDLLLTEPGDLADRPLPEGRLREGLSAAVAADAALVAGVDADGEAEQVGRTLGINRTFRVQRRIESPRPVAGASPPALSAGARVFAFAAIARPGRFFADLAGQGWILAGTAAFRDHKWLSRRDLIRLAEQARRAGADIMLTTEKDAARLTESDVRDLPIAAVPLKARIEPEREFGEWLIGRL
jgi:tetraacyldisaccharide 4'-kinase